jgi:hypothetical protein
MKISRWLLRTFFRPKGLFSWWITRGQGYKVHFPKPLLERKSPFWPSIFLWIKKLILVFREKISLLALNFLHLKGLFPPARGKFCEKLPQCVHINKTLVFSHRSWNSPLSSLFSSLCDILFKLLFSWDCSLAFAGRDCFFTKTKLGL